MRFLATGEEMQKIDQISIEQIGIPGLVLMERAALAVTEEIEKRFSRIKTGEHDTGRTAYTRILVVTECGNNGGDGLAVARMLAEKGYEIYATAGTATFLNAHGVNTTPVYWPDEKPDAENNVMKMIAEHKFDLIVNIPKNHTKRELTNGYKIRRGAIDHNIPLITNARLASAFIEAFCEMSEKDIQIKSWQDYK